IALVAPAVIPMATFAPVEEKALEQSTGSPPLVSKPQKQRSKRAKIAIGAATVILTFAVLIFGTYFILKRIVGAPDGRAQDGAIKKKIENKGKQVLDEDFRLIESGDTLPKGWMSETENACHVIIDQNKRSCI